MIRRAPRPPFRLWALLLPLAALGGCQQAGPGESDAAVSVLDGTASDAMLPLDTVTSQPPLDPRALRSARPGPGDGTEPATEPAGELPAAAEVPAPAPAAAPGPVRGAAPAE